MPATTNRMREIIAERWAVSIDDRVPPARVPR
jgi:hypothetical protein